MSKDDVGKRAYDFIKKGKKKKQIWLKFSNSCTKVDPSQRPFTCFMAGAPGSGKTELIKNNLTEVFDNCVIADADEIRLLLPGYNGKNAYKFTRATSIGVGSLHDKALKNKFNLFVDGTFALHYDSCKDNIVQNINKDRDIAIFYLYTHPGVAWQYAKKRQYTEGRKVSIRFFIRSFFDARKNVNRIKEEFGDRVSLIGVKSNYGCSIGSDIVRVNIDSVDEIQKIEYTYFSLFLRIVYANILLQKQRFLWGIKKMTKK